MHSSTSAALRTNEPVASTVALRPLIALALPLGSVTRAPTTRPAGSTTSRSKEVSYCRSTLGFSSTRSVSSSHMRRLSSTKVRGTVEPEVW